MDTLRIAIEAQAGRQAADAPSAEPVAPEITGLAANSEVLGANGMIAVVTRLPGRENELRITVTETYLDGTFDERMKTFRIANNAASNYRVGSNLVFVDTKGNTTVRSVELSRG
ncbi:hypothetical protein GCM10023160_06930 [Brachybacterium paraconglomeratum]|uniref:hypothetical protein n=1 Tax=Brachybacterium paraconglomeratum TaxID=173362 RepID=UPI0031EF52DC